MTFRYCPHCSRGCDNSCYMEHCRDYDCHDVNCPGHRGTKAPHGSRRYEKPRGLGPDWIIAESIDNGEYFWYPKDPQQDTIHQQISREHGPVKIPGFRYGYDSKGSVIAYYVSREAYDYAPLPSEFDDKYRSRTGSQRPGSRPQSSRGEMYDHERESRGRQHSRRGSRHETFDYSPEPSNRRHARRKSQYYDDDANYYDNSARERRKSTARRPSTSMPKERRQSTARRPSTAMPDMPKDGTGTSSRHRSRHRERSYAAEKELYRRARSRRASFHQNTSGSRQERPKTPKEEEPILPDEVEEPLSSDGEDEAQPGYATTFEYDINRLSERFRRM